MTQFDLLICLYYDGLILRMVVPLPTVTLIDMNKLAVIIIIISQNNAENNNGKLELCQAQVKSCFVMLTLQDFV